MVKVIELVPTLGYGGAEALIKDYALLCDKEKVEIIIVTWSGRLNTANEELPKAAGVRVIHLEELRYPNGKKLNPLQRICRKIGRFVDFRHLVMDEKPDVIHMHLRIGAYMKVLPLKKQGIRLIYTVHNQLERYFDKRPFKKKWFEYRECRRLIKKRNMLMLTLHDDMRKKTASFFDTDNVMTLHNGVDLERFNPNSYDKALVRRELGIDNDAFIIGHIGSVHPQKNHDYIVDMFCEYASKNPDAILLLVGKGVDKKRILEKIDNCGYKDRIVFLEGRSDIPQIMRAMDVFILPSRWEGYPIVALEAQAMGLPCILSDRITRECIVTDKIAMVSIDGPVAKWCDVIDKIRTGRDGVYEPMTGELGEYDIKCCIKKLEEIYSGNY